VVRYLVGPKAHHPACVLALGRFPAGLDGACEPAIVARATGLTAR
jgi:hypothetical protein